MKATTTLSRSEKLAGRVFVAEQQGLLLASFMADPPDYQAMPWHKIVRHPCEQRGGVSTALELTERYAFSGRYVVVDEAIVQPLREDEVVGGSLDHVIIPAGRFGFIHKVGRCRGCGKTARSRTGRLVDAYVRPPLEGRVAR